MLNNKSIGKYASLMTDMISTFLSFCAAIIIRFGSFSNADHPETYSSTLVWLLAFAFIYGILAGNNRDFIRRGYFVETGCCIRYSVALAVFWGLYIFLFRLGRDISRLVFGYAIVLNILIGYIIKVLLKKILRNISRGEVSGKKIIIVADADDLGTMSKKLKDKLDYDCLIVGTMEWNGDETALVEKLRTLAVDEVFLHLPGLDGKILSGLIGSIESMGVTCRVTVFIPGLDMRGASSSNYAGYNILSYGEGRDYGGKLIIKRVLDIFGGLVGCLITAVMYPFVALAIKTDSPGPVVFSQVRIGRNGRRFKIYKFRSMYVDAEARKKELEEKNEMKGLMFKLEDDPRITRIGSFLRKTSLDEFPQFLNVLKGEMSLVGTRPPTEDEFLLYTPYYRRRICMTPGLTGLWQVSGRSAVNDFDDVVKYDLEYIDNWSLGLDIKIILQTVGVVLLGKGAK